jgi:signal transduction histidine kinase
MFRIGKDGTYLDFKATSDKDLYVLPNQFLGKKIDEVMPPALAQQTMDYVEQALKTGELQIFEYQLLVSGNNRDYEGRIAVSGEDEVLAIVREVTDRKRAEKQLLTSKDAAEQANHSKSIFLADMSHELRTPLNAIIGYSEMLIEEAEDLGEPDSIPDLQRIQTAGNHLLTLINDILDISKIEAGKMELYPETFDVSYVIQEVVGRLFQFPQQGESPLRV